MRSVLIAVDKLKTHGAGLKRPECVLAHASGLLFAADWTGSGGVSILDPATGAMVRHLAADPAANLKPNGIALCADGSFLITRLDDAAGGVFRLFPDGSHETVLEEVEGAPLPPTNFVAEDAAGRLYVTVSTRRVPRHLAANGAVRDGFIVLKEPGRAAQVVALGLGYTNECLLSADGRTLFVNETFGRATIGFPVNADGTLGVPHPIAKYGDGIFPDGLALDRYGGLWVVSIISNTVLRLAPDGSREIVVADRERHRISAVEAAWRDGTLDRTLLDAPHTGRLKNVSSIAFGGPDLRTAYLGCLLGDHIASFTAPVAGHGLPHYRVSLDPLIDAGLIPGTEKKAHSA
ncbi:MAG: SMP-30/gluconolactonase/LRE family protein [Pseudomonadota bacterium]